MTETADTATTTRQPDIKLEYGQQPSTFPTFVRWWNRSRAEVQERFDGLYKFIGVILYALGGARPQKPDLARFMNGEGPAWYSPPLLAAVRARRRHRALAEEPARP